MNHDIAHCEGTRCPLRFKCKRFIAHLEVQENRILTASYEKAKYNKYTQRCRFYWYYPSKEIVKCVSMIVGTNVKGVMSQSRRKDYVIVRSIVAAYLSDELSSREIAEYFNRVSHTTGLNMLKSFQNRYRYDSYYKSIVDSIIVP